jgi:hypothetical protein
MKVRDFSFRKFIEQKPGGSCTLGFADFTLYDADGDEIQLKGLVVKKNARGENVLGAPLREQPIAGGQTRSFGAYHFGDATYERMRTSIYGLPVVVEALAEVGDTGETAAFDLAQCVGA